MIKTKAKLVSLSINEQCFPQQVWQGALQTRERVELLNRNWPELALTMNMDVNIYDCYPYLFSTAFPNIQSGDLSDFSLGIRLLASSVFHTDKIMDSSPQNFDSTATLAHVLALQVEAYRIFQQLFPPASSFWQYFHLYYAAFLRACMQEKKFVQGEVAWKTFDEETAREIAVDKAGLSRIVIAGLVALSGDERFHDIFNESLNLYNFAYQMFDDLCDWKEDYCHRSPSLLLCQWLPERPVEPKLRDLEHLARELYYDGHAQRVLELALASVEGSRSIISDHSDLAWHNILTNLYERCESLLNDILRITQANRQRTEKRVSFSLELPPPRTTCEQLAWRGLQLLLRQWQLGFGELRDVASFPHVEGFTGESEIQYGDVFQRAIIADTLYETSQTFQLDLHAVIKHEVNYLVEQRRRSGIGGWSYYPGLPEMPPDADDLAQVMQLLLHSGHSDGIVQYCEAPLATLLTDNRHDDGSFETWIIPLKDRTAEQERQWLYTQKAWGTGSDVDVMANLLYALALYDSERFAEIIRSGASYVEDRQQADGSWLSTWYFGPYYGTFVCTRLLARVKADSASLDAARTFLVASQLSDGSWTMDMKKGDPLSTSLALLSLAEMERLEAKRQPPISAIKSALQYLESSYDGKERAWPACDFIRTQERSLTDKVSREVSYGRQTMTTAFVLKASAVWHGLQNMAIHQPPA